MKYQWRLFWFFLGFWGSENGEGFWDSWRRLRGELWEKVKLVVEGGFHEMSLGEMTDFALGFLMSGLVRGGRFGQRFGVFFCYVFSREINEWHELVSESLITI